MKTAKLFKNGHSQAVRLPKEYRFEGDEVRIRREGEAVVLEPLDSGWDWLFEISGKFSEDYFADGREQPETSERRDTFGE